MRCMWFFRKWAKKGQKNVKKGQNIWKFGQKCTKFENILKKGRWLHAIIACNKLLEKVLVLKNYCFGNFVISWITNETIFYVAG